MKKPQSTISRRERIDLIAAEVLEAFRAGAIPRAAAQVVLHARSDSDYPARHWSRRNRFLAALRGHTDARGFQQWKEVGRSVRKGERAVFILAPTFHRIEDPEDVQEGEEPGTLALAGFVPVAVFGFIQTEGEPLASESPEAAAALVESLPLLDVAKAWGIEVEAIPIELICPGTLGVYLHCQDGSEITDQRILLASENLSIWAHELVHAAHARLGKLQGAPKPEKEAVAQLGATILLEVLGFREESDRGFTWLYLQSFAADHSASASLALALRMVEEACECVETILATAEALEPCGGVDLADREPLEAAV